ncbi:MAG: hypothetical protein ABI740_00620 [Alphaproteobacteria bacterium]
MGEGFDLAAVASAAGLGGSAIATIGALIFFKGIVIRILTQIVVTAALTGIGFLTLLNTLGFEIVPKPAMAASALVSPQSAENFSVQSVAPPPVDDGKTRIYVKSPWSKS